MRPLRPLLSAMAAALFLLAAYLMATMTTVSGVLTDTTMADGSSFVAGTWVGTPRQLQLAASPTSDEMVVVVSNSSSQDYAVVWNGSSWTDSIVLAPDGTGNDRTDVYVAYEQQSGEALVVFGKGTDDVYYRVWNAGWSGELMLGGIGGGYARWTTLGADPSGNRIALGVLTNDADGWVAMWDGAGQHPALPDLDLRVGWSPESSAPSIGENPNSMTLSPGSGTDGLMLAVQDDGSDLHWIHWNGSAWGPDHELETSSGETKNQPFLFL